MKTNFALLILLLAAGCKEKGSASSEITASAADPVALGQEIFEGSGNCFACHKPDQKIVGPSIREIAAIYKERNGDMVAFLKGQAKPIVDPSQYETMKINLEVTKKMSDQELEALEAYMYSVR